MTIDSGQKNTQPLAWSEKTQAIKSNIDKKEGLEIGLLSQIYGGLFAVVIIAAMMIPKVKQYFYESFSFRKPRVTASLIKAVNEIFAANENDSRLEDIRRELIQILQESKFNGPRLENVLATVGVKPSNYNIHMLRAIDGMRYLDMEPTTLRFLEEFLKTSIDSSILRIKTQVEPNRSSPISLIQKYRLDSWIKLKFRGEPIYLSEELDSFFRKEYMDIEHLQRIINLAGLNHDFSSDELFTSMNHIKWEEMSKEMCDHIIGTVKQIFSTYTKAYQDL
jgi:hypothetical protein